MDKRKVILITMIITVITIAILLVALQLIFGLPLVYSETHNFKLENLYFVLSSLGAIATVVAIFIAIYMPKRIAEQQNKIALFEKRYELYAMYILFFRKAVGGYDVLQVKNSCDGLDKEVLTQATIWDLVDRTGVSKMLDKTVLLSLNEKQMLQPELEYHISNFTLELEKASYLFSLDEKEIATLKDIAFKLMEFPQYIYDDNINFEEFKEKVLTIYKCITGPTILITMQEQLKLHSCVK